MLPLFVSGRDARTIPVWPVDTAGLEGWLAAQPATAAAWARTSQFRAQAGQVLKIPSANGELAATAFGLGEGGDPLLWRALPEALGPGTYAIEGRMTEDTARMAALAWALGSYRYERYKKPVKADAQPQLVLPDGVDGDDASRIAEGVFLARDLINTPANDMGPQELSDAAAALAQRHGAALHILAGEALLHHNYPMIHAVGKASVRPPRLLDMRWGDVNAPRVTLVGKGVVFDSGGLDLKPSDGMRLMKKDMGGAANVLGLAHMIMGAGLKLRLRVLIPVAENAVAGNAFRPGDILNSRKGLTVEIGNTDAEGRLILADALTEGASEQPEYLFDLATLTGAARTALGAEIPPFFTPDDALAAQLSLCSQRVADPLWRLPLWQPYARGLESGIADVNNVTEGGMAGAITAALFLQKFVEGARVWAHFDIYAWNAKAGPGQKAGGEAMAIRALYALLRDRF
ncbi:MAG: leucyl aminopeptidase family protein [Alphaproteobacteria bacterium]|nr:leucyl aminopeptidase family protein [Alphaproteobacteria bacterium]